MHDELKFVLDEALRYIVGSRRLPAFLFLLWASIVRLRTRLPDAGGVHDVSDIVVGIGHRRRRVAPGVGETFLGWLIPGARSGRPLQAFARRA